MLVLADIVATKYVDGKYFVVLESLENPDWCVDIAASFKLIRATCKFLDKAHILRLTGAVATVILPCIPNNGQYYKEIQITNGFLAEVTGDVDSLFYEVTLEEALLGAMQAFLPVWINDDLLEERSDEWRW